MYMDQKNTLVNVALKIHKKINTNSKPKVYIITRSKMSIVYHFHT